MRIKDVNMDGWKTSAFFDPDMYGRRINQEDTESHHLAFRLSNRNNELVRYVFGLDGKLLVSWIGFPCSDKAAEHANSRSGITFVDYDSMVYSACLPTDVRKFDPADAKHSERIKNGYLLASGMYEIFRSIPVVLRREIEVLEAITQYGSEHDYCSLTDQNAQRFPKGSFESLTLK
ncbi:hypothetical protein GF351_01655 [Candidatus Woesearchaeota archaeon]|nr:hypothetical protein [Candidatus Woesearchaeota archaeon]